MTYLLDTNVCVTYLRGKDVALMQKIQSHKVGDIALCSVVLGELWFGAAKSNQPQTHQAEIMAFVQPYSSLPFDDAAAIEFGNLYAHLKALGQPIGPFDLMIAATALANKLVLVTHNTKEFSRVPGLTLEDWQTP
ncbi:MAG: type II toxin-antitoxin system VapC family toxin [Planctomycetes bacterium]|nr:type II toxin-antitoxin system VapC family toxin [Planctomycetota bacterium]